ncbi:MAG: NAD(P)H-binding protein [Actinomycetota bacterium]|nr:NAD(P)H-binding protein [Actinomycetota bacterium]
MSVLLIGAGGELGHAIARRLLSQGDEVRAIENERDAGSRLRDIGVHVARGRELDSDLVERAAQNVRTVVAIDAPGSLMAEVIDGARAASVERVVACGKLDRTAVDLLRDSELDYVVLRSGPKGILRRGVEPTAIAAAVDAADDLAGRPRLDLDLGDGVAWKRLNVNPGA